MRSLTSDNTLMICTYIIKVCVEEGHWLRLYRHGLIYAISCVNSLAYIAIDATYRLLAVNIFLSFCQSKLVISYAEAVYAIR